MKSYEELQEELEEWKLFLTKEEIAQILCIQYAQALFSSEVLVYIMEKNGTPLDKSFLQYDIFYQKYQIFLLMGNLFNEVEEKDYIKGIRVNDFYQPKEKYPQNIIKRYRIKHNISFEEFAKKLEISNAKLEELESKENCNYSINGLSWILSKLNCSVFSFFGKTIFKYNPNTNPLIIDTINYLYRMIKSQEIKYKIKEEIFIDDVTNPYIDLLVKNQKKNNLSMLRYIKGYPKSAIASLLKMGFNQYNKAEENDIYIENNYLLIMTQHTSWSIPELLGRSFFRVYPENDEDIVELIDDLVLDFSNNLNIRYDKPKIVGINSNCNGEYSNCLVKYREFLYMITKIANGSKMIYHTFSITPIMKNLEFYPGAKYNPVPNKLPDDFFIPQREVDRLFKKNRVMLDKCIDGYADIINKTNRRIDFNFNCINNPNDCIFKFIFINRLERSLIYYYRGRSYIVKGENKHRKMYSNIQEIYGRSFLYYLSQDDYDTPHICDLFTFKKEMDFAYKQFLSVKDIIDIDVNEENKQKGEIQ